MPTELAIPNNPTVHSTDASGYKFDATSPEWKEACAVLPCFAALQWPDYSTKCIPDTINGKPVMIQLWKGRCEQFLGRVDFPGGIGGEVGVYVRVPEGRPLPELKMLPLLMRPFYIAAAALGSDHLWWPEPKLATTINFTLTNPKTKTEFLSTGPEKTYWLNKWMQFASFSQYEKQNQVPTWSTEFIMNYTINGKAYPPW
jgi:hypothetical protein